MIRVKVLSTHGELIGMTISGHAGADESGKDIVCAAVSSAVYMTANTITDVCRVPADITEEDGWFSLKVDRQYAGDCHTILSGFSLHMQQMQTQYPQYIEFKLTEV